MDKNKLDKILKQTGDSIIRIEEVKDIFKDKDKLKERIDKLDIDNYLLYISDINEKLSELILLSAELGLAHHVFIWQTIGFALSRILEGIDDMNTIYDMMIMYLKAIGKLPQEKPTNQEE